MTKYDAIRGALSGVLAVAGTMKWLELTHGSFAGAVSRSQGLETLGIAFELLLSAWLISGLCSRAAGWAALATFSVFAIVSLSKLLSGEASCGCFGRANVNPWFSFTFDLTAIIGLVMVPGPRFQSAAHGHAAPRSSVLTRVWMFTGSGCVAVAIDALLLATSGIDVLEPVSWIGHQFPLLEYIDIGPDIAKGTWTVVLIRHDCSECREAIGSYRRKVSDDAACEIADKLVFVDIQPGPAASRSLAPGFRVGRLNTHRRWFIETPMEVRLQDGIVIRASGPLKE